MTARRREIGLLAELATPEALLGAVRDLRGRGYRLLEAYTPYPIEGLDRELGFTRSWLNLVSGVAGAAGAGFAFWLQWLVNHR
ncbi:MAG TPA: quinol:electron acceptor oxidoreductase subunit ActD, partial [Polyangia bacterium]